MFILREFAACALLALLLTALLLVACGIGYLLRAMGIMLMRMFQEVAFRKAPQERVAIGFSAGAGSRIVPEPSVMSD
jgi:hypothetical protein